MASNFKEDLWTKRCRTCLFAKYSLEDKIIVCHKTGYCEYVKKNGYLEIEEK